MLRFLFPLLAAGTLAAQPAADYAIDTDGDGAPEGILYRDEVYDPVADVVAFADHLPGPPSFAYARDRATWDGDSVDLRLDVYAAPPGADTLAARDKPVILFFYGGGFIRGSSRRVEDLCREYASRGYVAVAPNYRLGFSGMDDPDALCADLRPSLEAVYRALLDAQAAARWIVDSLGARTGIDVSPEHLFLHGPSLFPMLTHLQDDEVPLFLRPLGALDDGLRWRGSVGRSASLVMADRFIDRRDSVPFLIFHGTCDKSVPFTETWLSTRNGCDSLVPPGTVIPGDVAVAGSYDLVRAVRHYVAYYPICGLHHSHKDIEAKEMREPVAQFLYDRTVGHIRATDPPLFHPWIVAPCDVNAKCTPEDRYGWCDGSVPLPPRDSAGCAGALSREAQGPAVAGPADAVVFPNPGAAARTLRWTPAADGPFVLRVVDRHGRTWWTGLAHGRAGVPAQVRFRLPEDAPAGVYRLRIGDRPGPAFVRE